MCKCKYSFPLFIVGWEPILDECYRQIMSEFNYKEEAQNLYTIRKAMLDSPFQRKVKVPEPHQSLCTKEVLVMEFLLGKKLSAAFENDLENIMGSESRVKEYIHRKRLDLILGSEKMDELGLNGSEEIFGTLGFISKLRLLKLSFKVRKVVDLLVDVQGYQIFHAALFQGDPHLGNTLLLHKDGSLIGLLDWGQVKLMNEKERIGLARIIYAVGTGALTTEIASSMRELGFQTKYDNDDILAQYAALFFDSDIEGKKRYNAATPQAYFKSLVEQDPLLNVPDVASKFEPFVDFWIYSQVQLTC